MIVTICQNRDNKDLYLCCIINLYGRTFVDRLDGFTCQSKGSFDVAIVIYMTIGNNTPALFIDAV